MIDKKHYYFELDANRGTLNHMLTESETTFILELCHKYQLKILQTMDIRTQWSEQYWTFNSNDTTQIKSNAKAIILTKHGFPNLVAWVHDDTYYISANARLKERSDGKYLHSKRMKDVIRKFDKRIEYVISLGNLDPFNTQEWLSSSLVKLPQKIYQSVTRNNKLEHEYSTVTLSGASLHLLLDKAHANNEVVSSNVTEEWKQLYTTLNYNKDKQQEGNLYAMENLHKPFYILSKPLMTKGNDRVTVTKVKMRENSKHKLDILEVPVTYQTLEDCPLHDKFRPQLMMWAMHSEMEWKDNSYRKPEWLVNNVIADTSGTYEGKFDESTKTGNTSEGSSTDYEILYTYLLDVD